MRTSIKNGTTKSGPNLKKIFKESGISNYSIFWDEETNNLYAVKKISSENNLDLKTKEVVWKWWDYMADIMETNPDNSPAIVPLKEVFYLG